MALVGCFSFMSGKKKKSKESGRAVDIKKVNGNGNLRVKPEEPVNPPTGKDTKEAFFEVSVPHVTQESNPPCNAKAAREGIRDEHSGEAAAEAAYEGGDEHDEILSMKRDFSDFDLQARAAESGEIDPPELNNDRPENKSDPDDGTTPEAMIQSGHVSDPGMARTATILGSPTLKRSCSNIETKRAVPMLDSSTKPHSYDDARWDDVHGVKHSPLSVASSCSADRVMLKKRSSSQVLPSRSRKLWWRLFLWSHRNLHRPWAPPPQRRLVSVIDPSNQKGGYSSDTLEPSHEHDKRSKEVMEAHAKGKRPDLWPHNEWVAFSAESSSLDRVDAWVNSLDDNPFTPLDDDDNSDGEEAGVAAILNSRDVGESSGKNHPHAAVRRSAEEVVQANSIIQSLNTLSSVAHIAGMGLKVIPAISAFTSLRSVNLSGNFIVRITPGLLPKSLHSLDLSRNKISTIEGLRELTRLRVLNLSYNRISRIGHGFSNCTLIKELYLAGNKISDVEGLHRLLKLTVLDLSFNKITTTKALGQLVANYNSLLALNLLGNPIQSNIGDDQLRKAVSGLLPQLAYLNKQPIKPQRAREVATDSVAKAALGNNGWSSRRKQVRRVSQSSGSLGKSRSGEGSSHRAAGSGAGRNSSHRSSRAARK